MAENTGKQPKTNQDETRPVESGPETLPASPHLFSALPPAAPARRQHILHMQHTLGNQTTMRWLRQQDTNDVPSHHKTLPQGPALQKQPLSAAPALRTKPHISPPNIPTSQDDTGEQMPDEQAAVPGAITVDEPPSTPDHPMDNQNPTQSDEISTEVTPSLVKTYRVLQRTPAGVDPNAPTAYELQIPQPAETLSPQEKKRLEGVQVRMTETSQAQAEMPSATESVTDARAAVTEPPQETRAHAGEELTAELGQEAQPSLEIEELCVRIRTAIHNRRPPSEESLLESDPAEAAQAAGQELNTSLEGEARRVQGEYDALDQTPTGTPVQTSTPIGPMPDAESTADLNAASTVPDPLAESEVSLEADAEANNQRIERAGMDSTPAQLVQSGPIAEARAAQNELEAAAQTDPQQIMREQQATIDAARADMDDLQAHALSALHASRSKTVGTIHTGQTGMIGSEEQMRQQIGEQAQSIFETAQQRVGELLDNLSQKAMQRWDAGVAQLSTTFENRLSQVADWIQERHGEGVIGTVTAGWDSAFGYPGWIVEAYDVAESDFADGVCDLLRDISIDVNGVVAACHALIEQARDDISGLLTSLPPELHEWAMNEQVRFDEQLTGLSARAETTRTEFNQHITQKAAETVQSARERIYTLRQKAEGLVGRISNAISAFLADPARFIIEGLLESVCIAPAAFWALIDRIRSCMDAIAEDPIAFANNLVSALRTGFEQFFGNIETHLTDGLLQWLFSGLGNMGIQAPQDFSLESVMTFFLQMMGISWTRIREILTQHVGQDNIELVEQAWSFITDLIQQGPVGIFNMIRDQLDPQGLLDMILQEAINYVTETLVDQVMTRLLGMLNPAGAIIQAMEVIYRILDWVFNNAAQLFSLMETIVGGIADIVSGNLGGMANAIEQGLARILPTVIDFLAGFLGLGDLPERVVEIVRGLQGRVEEILNRIIGWLVTRAKGIIDAMSHPKDEQEKPSEASDSEAPLSPEDEKTLERGKHVIHQEEHKYANPEGEINENEAQQVAQVAEASPYFSSIRVGQKDDHWHYDSVIQRSRLENGIDGANAPQGIEIEQIPLSDIISQQASLLRVLIADSIVDNTDRFEDPAQKKNYAFADYKLWYRGQEILSGTHVAVSSRGQKSADGRQLDEAYTTITPALQEMLEQLTPEARETFLQVPDTMAPYDETTEFAKTNVHRENRPTLRFNDDHTEPKLEAAVAKDIDAAISKLIEDTSPELASVEDRKKIAQQIRADLQLNVMIYTEAVPCVHCGIKPANHGGVPFPGTLNKMLEWANGAGLKDKISLKVLYTYKDPDERTAFYDFFHQMRQAVGADTPDKILIDVYYKANATTKAKIYKDRNFYTFVQAAHAIPGVEINDLAAVYGNSDGTFWLHAHALFGSSTDFLALITLYKSKDQAFRDLFALMMRAGVDQNTLLDVLHDEEARQFFLKARQQRLGVTGGVMADLYRNKDRLVTGHDVQVWAEKWTLKETQMKNVTQFLEISG